MRRGSSRTRCRPRGRSTRCVRRRSPRGRTGCPRAAAGASTSTTTRAARSTAARVPRRARPTAVRKTSRQILRYHKKVITAFFFSTSGGRTESIQYAFGGSPVPYLKSVKDPYDDTSPYHSWKVRYSQGEMESRLSGLFRGRLKKVK